MDDEAPPARNSSRTAVIVAVVALIVIAIAGIVLAALRDRAAPTSADAASPSSTPASAAAMTGAAASAGAVADDEGPNRIRFAAGSDKLPANAPAKLAQVTQTAKSRNNKIVVATKLDAGNDRDASMELAKRRTEAVRQALAATGMATTAVRIEITELPAGLVPARDVDRVELNLR